MATIRPHALARVTSVDADDTIIVDRASSTPRSVKLTDALNSTDLSNAKVKETDMFNPLGVGGKTEAFPLVAYVKGEIRFAEQYAPVLGIGISAGDRAANASKLYYAGIESGNRRRPLLLPKGERLVTNSVPFATNYVEINGNGCEIIHESTTSETVFSFNGVSGASRLIKPKLYNIIIDGKGHTKSATFYPLASNYRDGAWFEDIEIRDPFDTAYLMSDPYDPTTPWPAMTSSDLTMKNIRVTRTAANISAIAGKPLMMQGDQGVVTGVSGYRLSRIKAYYSGRSGLSLGLCENGVLEDFEADQCQTGLYVETIVASRVSGFNIYGHMHHNGAAGATDTNGILVTTGDETLPGTGYATARNLIISNGTIRDVSTVTGTNKYHGIRVQGRNGASHAKGVHISDVNGFNLSSVGGASMLTFEGALTGCVARNINIVVANTGFRGDVSYTAPGGSATNVQTDTWVDGLHCNGVTAAVAANNSGGTHTRSGVRNSTFGGGTTAFTGTLTNHTTNTA